jgi:HNH endonuclease
VSEVTTISWQRIITEPQVCAHCGGVYERPLRVAVAQFRGRRFCSRACSGLAQRTARVWYRRRGQRLEHRVVMEELLGWPLRQDELVHHKNEDKTDNRPENLELMDRTTHVRHHQLKHPLIVDCAICGTTFEPTRRHRGRRTRSQRRTCSPRCRAILRLQTLRANRAART